MILDIKQQNKEMFEANFNIISNENILGSINVKGRLGSTEVSLKGFYNNLQFELKNINNLHEKNKNFKTYQIIVSGKKVGEIYQVDKKTSLFSKYSYNELNYEGKYYKEYGIGLGKEVKNTIYLNENQISQINKETIIYNDLHNFKIYVKNDKYLLVAILFSCYMYINGCFKPGVKVKKSIVKCYNKTTNKELNSKYNPNWIKEIKEEK